MGNEVKRSQVRRTRGTIWIFCRDEEDLLFKEVCIVSLALKSAKPLRESCGKSRFLMLWFVVGGGAQSGSEASLLLKR